MVSLGDILCGVGFIGIALILFNFIVGTAFVPTSTDEYMLVIPNTNAENIYSVGSVIASNKVLVTWDGPASIVHLFNPTVPRMDIIKNKRITICTEHDMGEYIYKGIVGGSKLVEYSWDHTIWYYNSSVIDLGGNYKFVISKVNPDSSIVGEWMGKED